MSDADCTPGREPRSVAASFTSTVPEENLWESLATGFYRPYVLPVIVKALKETHTCTIITGHFPGETSQLPLILFMHMLFNVILHHMSVLNECEDSALMLWMAFSVSHFSCWHHFAHEKSTSAMVNSLHSLIRIFVLLVLYCCYECLLQCFMAFYMWCVMPSVL